MLPQNIDNEDLTFGKNFYSNNSKMPLSSPLPSSSSTVTMSSFQTSSSISAVNPPIRNILSPISTSTAESTPVPFLQSRDSNNVEFSDESDDELQDWSLLNNFSKKGMKDLEPLLTSDDRNQLSLYDQNKLNKARNLRFNALEVKRGSIVNLDNLKPSTIYINPNDYDDLFMLQPKGKFLETMGVINNNNLCHFGFEEVLYLVERGSCMLKFYDVCDDSRNIIYSEMPPFSLQAAYSLLITSEEKLNQYLVYSILKRDGYIITRNEEFMGKISNPTNKLIGSKQSLFKNVQMSWYTKFLKSISEFFNINFPMKFTFSYFNIFTYLHSKILKQSLTPLENTNLNTKNIKHYKISFNVWKPSPNFKKKNPPPPDYQISIFNAAERLPKYLELKSLLERSNSNPFTYKPKPKTKSKGTKTKNEGTNNNGDDINRKNNDILDSSWDYSKGINITNLKYDPHRITLAIVDNATVNFITLSHCSFVSEGPVWRDHWVTWRPPQKKKRISNKRQNNPKNLKVDTIISNNQINNTVTSSLPKSANF